MNRALVNIDVENLDLAIQFYTQAFDLKINRRLGPDAAELLGLDVPLYLLSNPKDSIPFDHAPQGRNYSRHWTPVHLDIVVQSIETAFPKAIAAGASAEGEITQTPWGKIVLMSDPFGNGFCLLQFEGKGYDEISSPPF
jgi:lactoylglutathione lyase